MTREEISRYLKRSKTSKAPGPNGVLYEHLKVVQEICPDSLAGLLNKYLYNRKYPVNWKVAKLAVIPKGKGASLTKAGPYRPISLLSAMEHTRGSNEPLVCAIWRSYSPLVRTSRKGIARVVDGLWLNCRAPI